MQYWKACSTPESVLLLLERQTKPLMEPTSFTSLKLMRKWLGLGFTFGAVMEQVSFVKLMQKGKSPYGNFELRSN